MAWSGVSDCITFKRLKRAGMWQHKEHPIVQGVKTVNLHLSEGGTWRITLTKGVITTEIKPTEMNLKRPIAIQRRAFHAFL